MPRGTVRAFITLTMVSFPFGYLLTGEVIPPLIVNPIFIVIIFYFEARTSTEEKLKQIVNEIKITDLKTLDLKEEKMPLTISEKIKTIIFHDYSIQFDK